MFEKKKFENDVLQDIKSFSERIRAEIVTATENEKMAFGVKFLDEALFGIRKNDFIVIAAKTGFGKSELAKIIALENAPKKRVHFFALEAEPNEIEMRIKYSYMAKGIYGELKEYFKGFIFNYADWVNGEYRNNDLIKKLSEAATEFMAEEYKNLKTYYQINSTITDENIESTLLGIQNETDLIIIDHLHYFTFCDDNENRAMKKLMMRFRELSLKIGKPIILLAHVRKSERRGAALVPGFEDIHGSSDVSKIATKIIILAAANEIETGSPTQYATFFRIAKCRLDGSRTKLVGVLNFDITRNAYRESYLLGRLNFDETEIEIIDEERKEKVPRWAKSFIPQPAQTEALKPFKKPFAQKRADIYE